MSVLDPGSQIPDLGGTYSMMICDMLWQLGGVREAIFSNFSSDLLVLNVYVRM
jgi:hypothetical protein